MTTPDLQRKHVSDSRLRVGVIGLGLIAQTVHLLNLHTLRERYQITRLCDLSQDLGDKVAAEWGATLGDLPPVVCQDPAEVFADPDVEAVLLLTPGTHDGLAEAALLEGKHVLAEKPLAHTVARCLELQELAVAQDRTLQVAYMKMYDPILARAVAELDSIGTLRLVRVTVLHPADDAQVLHHRVLRGVGIDQDQADAAHRGDTEDLRRALGSLPEPFYSIYADVLQGSVVHEMSLLRALLGELPLVWSHAQIGEATPGVALAEPPQLQALGRLGEAQVSLSWNWVPENPEYLETVELIGSAGSLLLSMAAPYQRDHRSELTVSGWSGSERQVSVLRSDSRTGFLRELEAFASSVQEGSPVRSTAEGAAWDTRSLQGLIKVAASAHGVGPDETNEGELGSA